jgi:hypothetical protein
MYFWPRQHISISVDILLSLYIQSFMRDRFARIDHTFRFLSVDLVVILFSTVVKSVA